MAVIRCLGCCSTSSKKSHIPMTAITKYHKLDGLKHQALSCFIVLEARSLKSRCWQCRAASKNARQGAFPTSLLSLSSCSCRRSTVGASIQYSRDILHKLFCLCVFESSICICLCVQIFPFYKDTSRIGLRPSIRPDLNLITS